MNSTALRQRTLLRRKPLRSSRRSKYAQRERDTEHMLDVKRLGCVVRRLWPIAGVQPTPCRGHVEADHQGQRALGRKADDSTCVAMCVQHHRERTDHTGAFKAMTRDQLRAWRSEAIALTQREVAEMREWRAA